jgi:predicted TIM-barrel fold metal-dependent hydrolase
LKKIDFEAHFVTEEWTETFYKNDGFPRFVEEAEQKRRLYYHPDACEPFGDFLLNRLRDVGEDRIAYMDAAGVDVQVLSLTAPGVEHLDPRMGAGLARRANDALAEKVQKYPDRFMGFASLATKDPEEAVMELERAVKELGLKGWKTHSNYGDSYLDDKRYWPLLAKAQELDIPIFLHPASPMIPQLRTYGFALGGAPFGFGIETSLVMMRLILSGALDAFPDLKIILGHLGEGLPFVLQRIDFAFVRPHLKADRDVVPPIKKSPSEYLKRNMFMATSGNYLGAAFRCTQEALGIDKIIFGSDYPYEDSSECISFLEGLNLSKEERSKVYYQNADRLRKSGFSPN